MEKPRRCRFLRSDSLSRLSPRPKSDDAFSTCTEVLGVNFGVQRRKLSNSLPATLNAARLVLFILSTVSSSVFLRHSRIQR